MCFAPLQYTSRSSNQNIAELAPVFLIVIDNERDLRIVSNVAQAFEISRRSPLRLFIDGRVEGFAVEREADRDHVRLTESIGRGEMSDTGRANEAGDVSGKA